MRMEIHLPAIIEYHETADTRDCFRALNDKLRVKEIGFYDGSYVGIVYEHGTLKEPECQIMIKEVRRKTKE